MERTSRTAKHLLRPTKLAYGWKGSMSEIRSSQQRCWQQQQQQRRTRKSSPHCTPGAAGVQFAAQQQCSLATCRRVHATPPPRLPHAQQRQYCQGLGETHEPAAKGLGFSRAQQLLVRVLQCP